MKSKLLILTFCLIGSTLQAISEANVKAIYEKLGIAKGDFSRQLPNLEISDRVYNIADYSHELATLTIEEKAIGICAAFNQQSETALAFLIGHELTHFYQDQQGTFGFFMEKENFESKIKAEVEADIYGAMLAYFAGYRDVVDIMPRIIDHLYAGYGLDHLEMANYPSKENRKKLIEEATATVKTLIQLYETAKYLSVTGQYTHAGDLYGYIAKYVITKEILNNQAVAYLSAATQIHEFGKKNWHYPLNIDLNNPLRVPEDALKEDLLKKAGRFLQIATKFDTQYYTGQLNYAICFAMQGQLANALAQTNKAAALANSQQEVLNTKLTRAIILAQKGNQQESTVLLKDIKKSGNDGLSQLANNNLQLLVGKQIAPQYATNSYRTINCSMEKIDLSNRPVVDFDQTLELSDDPFSPKTLYLKQLPNSTLALLEMYDKSIVVHHSQSLPNNGIRPGMSINKIQTMYQAENSRILPHNKDGFFLEFPNLGLIFLIDASERLQEWAIFAEY